MVNVIKNSEKKCPTLSPDSKHVRINDIEVSEVKKLLEEHGILLFRDFSIDVQQYSDFLNRFCKKVTLDPARKFVTQTAQLVDSGLEEMPLHSENSLTAFVPDIIAFFCEIPAASGSQTTYCDGQAVWKVLSAEMKEYFTKHTFYFKRVLPQKLWETYLRNHLNLQPEAFITKEIIEAMITSLPQHHFEVLENGDLVADLKVPLAHPSYFSNEISFCNSLIGPSYNYQNPIARDDSGNPIPQKYYEEFRKISDELTYDIAWKTHDMVVVDNTRYMHGRRRIDDPNRKLYAGMDICKSLETSFRNSHFDRLCSVTERVDVRVTPNAPG